MTTLVSTRERPAPEAGSAGKYGSQDQLPNGVTKLVQAAGWGVLGSDAWAHNLNNLYTFRDRRSPHRDRVLVSPWGARSAGRSTGRAPDHALPVRGSDW